MIYQGGIGGMGIPIKRAIAYWNKTRRAAYDFFGDKHTFERADNYVANGSMVGFDSFALDRIKAGFRPPVQAFSIIDKDNGLTLTKEIFCRPVKRWDLLENPHEVGLCSTN